jgi:hypothetical protein
MTGMDRAQYIHNHHGNDASRDKVPPLLTVSKFNISLFCGGSEFDPTRRRSRNPKYDAST